MNNKSGFVIFAVGIVAALSASVVADDNTDKALLERAQQLFKPLPADAGTADYPVTPERVALGRALFFEPRVSTDGVISCAKCHQPSLYGTDALPRSVGNSGKIIPRNAPTVFNTALQFVQQYGGNRQNVEEQAVKATISPLAFGVTQDYWVATGSKEIELFKGRDKGRFQDTKSEADAFMFKVQQLRNVAVTPPYFHDGSVADLHDAVRIMAKLQLGRDLGADEVNDLVAFLESLTGEVPQQFASVPNLPPAAYRGQQ